MCTSTKGVTFFTDGSKIMGKVGAGVFSDTLNWSTSFRLPDHCSVFQAEALAIDAALMFLKRAALSTKDIWIFSDSQAALKALKSNETTSTVIRDCKRNLEVISQYYSIKLCWVPGHSDIAANCKADELARESTEMTLREEHKNIGTPMATVKLLLSQATHKKSNSRWQSGTTCDITRKIWPVIDSKRTLELVKLSRKQISTVAAVITGHCIHYWQTRSEVGNLLQ